MALHLIKLCVGVDRIEQLTEWGRAERGLGRMPVITTRQTPKRAAEIEDGGSLYWVIRGIVLCRQPVEDITTADGRCIITLSPQIIPTAPLPRRAFQGWRYLEAKDAPADLSQAEAQGLPSTLASELRSLGAW